MTGRPGATPAESLIRRRAATLLELLPELEHDGAIDDVVDRARTHGLRPHSLELEVLDAYLIGHLAAGALMAGRPIELIETDRYLEVAREARASS